MEFKRLFIQRGGLFVMVALTNSLLTGCLEKNDLGKQSVSASSSYNGCNNGTPIDNSSVSISFTMPSNATRVAIYRNGVEVGSVPFGGGDSFIDTGLTEGQTYSYECHAFENNKKILGANTLTLSPVNTNAPTFGGITSSSVLGARSANAGWAPASATGPRTAYYKIYANPGTSVNWSLAARTTVASGTFSATFTNFGDELTYSLGVRACTSSNICDSNTVQLTRTLTDGGAPLTVGATAATANNGQVTLTAPWSEANGAIKKRYVYKRTGAVGGTNIADYTLEQTVNISNYASPQTSIIIPGISDHTTYHFIVQDEDPSGNNNGNTSYVTLATGDTTPPVFSGFSAVNVGSPADTVVTGTFTAINREGFESSDGAYTYVIYKLGVPFPTLPGNACTSGTVHSEFSAASYVPGVQTVSITGLTPRTSYSFCLKAKDSSGNLSTNTADLTLTTRDITAPTFDGIQTITFNSTDSKIYLTWNTASATDLSQYKIRLWKNTASPTAGDITTFYRTSSSSPTGTTFATSEYSFSNLDVVYALVDACDDAQTIAGGTQNCSASLLSSAKNVALPAFQPPVGFPGIKTSASQVSTVEGQATIAWNAPTVWTSDYTGFKIYSVNTTTNALTALASCPCAVPGSCTTVSDTSCTISGLNPGRTYRFHVRAYNSGNFETTYLDPAVNYADKKIADTTAPTFNSGLTIGVGPTYTLNWAAATDNQYTGDGAVVSYKVYRKANTTFGSATNPSADGTLVVTTPSTTYNDSGWLDGTTYFYAVCAVDISNNSKCDGTVQSISVTDVTAPTITSFTTLKTSQADLKKWTLNWTMADNTTAAGSLRVRLYQSTTNTSSTATTSDTLLLDSTGDTSFVDLSGPINLKKYMNYLLWVQDAAGNTATSTLSVLSDNVITITSIQRNTGTTSGGQVVVLEGTGFSNGSLNGYGTSTAITLAGSNCTSVDVVNSTLMTCVTPAGVNGPAVLVLTNPEGSSTTQAGMFTYLSSSSEVCDNPGSWGTQMAAGTGISADPFIICNATHLDNVRKKIADGGGITYNYIDGNYYFKLGANINLNGVTFPSIGGESSGRYFIGNFDGGGYSVLNWSRTSTSQLTGFFGRAGNVTISNFKILNASVSSNDVNHAILIGNSSGVVNLSNITVNGIVTNTKSTGTCCGNAAALLIGLHTGSYNLTINNINVSGSVTTNALTAGGVLNFGGATGGIANISNVTATNIKVKSTSGSVAGFGILGPGAGTHTFSNIFLSGNVDTDITYSAGATGFWISSSATSALLNFNKIGVKVESNKLGGAGGTYGAFMYSNSSSGCALNISESYFSGSANYGSNTNTYNAGFLTTWSGVVASSIINITDSYMVGETIAGSNYGGAFHLGNTSSWTGFTVSNFMSAVKLTGAYATNGVAVGTSSGTATNSFWDYVKAARTTSEAGSMTGITAKTTTQMQDQATNIYSAAGWDFTPVTGKWKWCSTSDYPHLMWETCP